jgi:hypothetical protein
MNARLWSKRPSLSKQGFLGNWLSHVLICTPKLSKKT